MGVTRADLRAECIEAMAIAGNAVLCDVSWDDLPLLVRDTLIASYTRAFDSLHGIAFVDPIEATEEMIIAARAIRQKFHDGYVAGLLEDALWSAMAATGDLTNPPGEKP